MRYFVVLVLAAHLQHAAGMDESGRYAIWGAGLKSCHSYGKARAKQEDASYRDYLMGYLTAYNALTPETYRLSAGQNLEAILGWFDAYCGARPVHGFDQAVLEFISEHHPARRKRAAGGRWR